MHFYRIHSLKMTKNSKIIKCVLKYLIIVDKTWYFNPKKTGGGGRPPLDISRDYSATRKALAATLYDFFLSSFPHIWHQICDARGYGSEVT